MKGSDNDRTRVDYGTLTLLFQDNVGGLEVENPHTRHFQPAKPIVCLILHLNKYTTQPLL
jgi:isopenicillin N synthase-like dioxygenase